jgi:hypothetical protein
MRARMSGTQPPIIVSRGAGAIVALLVCTVLLPVRASAADLALHVAPKPQSEAAGSVQNPLKRLFEKFLHWRRMQPH